MRTSQEIIDYRKDLFNFPRIPLGDEAYTTRLVTIQTLSWVLDKNDDRKAIEEAYDLFKEEFLNHLNEPQNEHNKLATQILCAKVSTLAWVLEE